MFFGHHISSHDYYSLPLVPIAALSLGALGGAVLRGLAEQASESELMRFFIRLMMLFVVVMTFWQVRIQMLSVDYRPQAEYWASIGDALGHTPSNIALTQDYGYPLVYWGWQRATIWPEYRGERASDIESRVKSWTKGMVYFLVTDFDELKLQPELGDYLNAHYPIHVEGDGYVIFDLTRPLK